MEGDMKPYCDLDATGKKARKASGKINCEKCPAKAKCDLLTFDVCTYVFEEGFRKGYNQRKREEKKHDSRSLKTHRG
jgi:hypothetical protein